MNNIKESETAQIIKYRSLMQECMAEHAIHTSNIITKKLIIVLLDLRTSGQCQINNVVINVVSVRFKYQDQRS